MADSDSLPLQGPPQPAHPVSAAGPPPLPDSASPEQSSGPWPQTVVGAPGEATVLTSGAGGPPAVPPPVPPSTAISSTTSTLPPTRTPWPTVAVPSEQPAQLAPTVSSPPTPAPPANSASRATMPTVAPGARPAGSPPPRAAAVVPQRRVPLARPAASVAPDEATKKQEEESLEEKAYKAAPPWLVSALVHMLVLIMLGLWWVAPKFTGNHVAELDAIYADRIGDQLLDPTVLSGTTSPDHADKLMITPTDLQPVEDPFAAPPQPQVSLDGTTAAAALHATTIGMALAGRQEGMRQSLLGAYGGNKLTEKGVQLGLEWIARHQRPDGSWSLKGPYSDGAYNENFEAATAMALLALQGNGNTHQSGVYRKNVAAGIQYLMKMQSPDGNFYAGNRNTEWFYTHAQCTIAICELYGMTKDSSLRLAAEKGIQFCIESQSAMGGWRYRPRDDSDTSVTGWVVMALQSARMAGLEVPQKTLDAISSYLDKAGIDGTLYAYQPGHQPTVVMTAEALLCRQYLGWNQYDPKLVAGVEYVGSHLPNWLERDVYYWYYGTQLMHHMGGEHWKRWNGALRDMLVEHQESTGPEKGSWHPKGKSPDAWGIRDQGGRLYVTCLSLYMLEVYYRHLPLYAQAAAGH